MRSAARTPSRRGSGCSRGRSWSGSPTQELGPFTEPGRADKVARRDLPAACARGGLGATTVSATIWAAARAGIAVSATGGIGGVHPGEHPDVSADLVELSRTPGLLVCSGPKSIIDPAATVERLEELGVSLVGYGVSRLPVLPGSRCAGRAGASRRHPRGGRGSARRRDRPGRPLDDRAVQPDPPRGGDGCRRDRRRDPAGRGASDERGCSGARRGRPHLLAAIAELTDGRSLEANLALLAANAGLAGDVAAGLGRLDRGR